MIASMSVGHRVHDWRLARHQSTDELASKAHLAVSALEAIESGEFDPQVSVLEKLAEALQIPPAWLYADPQEFELLFKDGTEEGEEESPPTGTDPVTQRILMGARVDRSLFVLLTALMQSGDPKLLRAAEVSLRSLVKQSRQASVPWQSRPPGHFEPPSD